MLKNVSLKMKILLAMIGMAAVTFLAVSSISFHTARQGLSQQAFNQLTAVREIKKKEVVDYFETIEHQILTFSENEMIINAMDEFRAAFPEFLNEINAGAPPVQEMKDRVLTYYTADFLREYQSQNSNGSIDVRAMVNGLDDNQTALQYHYIAANQNPLGAKHLLDTPKDASRYSRLHKRVHPIIRSYLEKFGYYDIFLVDPDSGNIVYSVFKELDYATSLKSGAWAGTNFAHVFEQAARAGDKDFIALADYEKYPPSYEAPASFIASPVYKGDAKIGVVVFQMPLDRVNAIMSQRQGLGETGETYLVGADHLMRSDSFLDPENHSVIASFKHPEKGHVKTSATQKALSGKDGNEIITDYNGNPVLSSYSPISPGGLNWAILSEIDKAEAFEPITSLMKTISVLAVCVILFTVFFAVMISRSLTRGISKAVDVARNIAKGDLTQQLDIHQKDEVGRLINALNEMAQNLRNMFSGIASGIETLTASSSDLSAVSEQISASVGQTSEKSANVSASAQAMSDNMDTVAAATEEATASIQMIVSATEEMSATLQEVAKNTARGSETTSRAVASAREVSAKVDQLNQAATQINKVTETIADISEQTNLLALNATIEAARAGEAGKGFAVVASEIKDLAHQTALATQEINARISEVQGTTSESIESINVIVTVINEIDTIVTAIAGVIEEQTATTREIANNVSQAAAGLGEVNENVNKSSTVAGEVTQEIASVNEATTHLEDGSRQILDRAGELKSLAENLNAMTARFKI